MDKGNERRLRESTEHRAQSTEHRAQSTEQRAKKNFTIKPSAEAACRLCRGEVKSSCRRQVKEELYD